MNIVLSYKKRLTAVSLVVASVVVAIAAPLQTVSAQSAAMTQANTALTQLKQRVTTAIDTSLTKLKDSQQSLSVTASFDKNGANVSATGPNGSSASGSVSQNGASGTASSGNGSSASGSVSKDAATGEVNTSDGSSASSSVSKDGAKANSSVNGSTASIDAKTTGITGSISVPGDLKSKLQQSNQKAIDKLNELKIKIAAITQIDDLKAKAKEFDVQFKEVAVANVQATVTKSIDSATRVLDRLQLAADSIETQINKIKECIQGVNVDASASKKVTSGSANANASINASAPGCENLNVDANAGDLGASLEDQLAEARSSMQTIRSFLTAAIGLVTQLKEGNYTGTVTSFQGIASQVDIVFSLAANVQNILVNLSTTVSK